MCVCAVCVTERTNAKTDKAKTSFVIYLFIYSRTRSFFLYCMAHLYACVYKSFMSMGLHVSVAHCVIKGVYMINTRQA